jgi:hypothetical protein
MSHYQTTKKNYREEGPKNAFFRIEDENSISNGIPRFSCRQQRVQRGCKYIMKKCSEITTTNTSTSTSTSTSSTTTTTTIHPTHTLSPTPNHCFLAQRSKKTFCEKHDGAQKSMQITQKFILEANVRKYEDNGQKQIAMRG